MNRYNTFEEDKVHPMHLQTPEEHKVARKVKDLPKPVINRTVIQRGIMTATIYPNTGAVLIRMDSGTGCALTYEEAKELKGLLNVHLPDDDPTMSEESMPDLDI